MRNRENSQNSLKSSPAPKYFPLLGSVRPQKPFFHLRLNFIQFSLFEIKIVPWAASRPECFNRSNKIFIYFLILLFFCVFAVIAFRSKFALYFRYAFKTYMNNRTVRTAEIHS